jgi:hypothetical protein
MARRGRVRSSRRVQRAERLGGVLAGAEPIVRTAFETARSVRSDAAEQGRKAGRRARKAAKRSARDVKSTKGRAGALARYARPFADSGSTVLPCDTSAQMPLRWVQ